MKLQPFAQHEYALALRARRHEVLSANLANADTPNYKARDIDFATALRRVSGDGMVLERTNDLHLASAGARNASAAPALYRIPMQPSLDGNTVESDVEQSAYADNAIRYRATLTFLNGTIKTLRYALKGGE